MRLKLFAIFFMLTVVFFTKPGYSTSVITDVTVRSDGVYEVDTMNWWGDLYTNRTYFFNSLPNMLVGHEFIRTANSPRDKTATDADFLQFKLSLPATVYVVYDIRATSLPEWLESWTDTGMTIGTTDVDRKVYSKDFKAGNVALGGNGMPPMEGAGSMYNVIAIPVWDPMRDLCVVSINTNPVSPTQGEEITVMVTVKNQGIADAGLFSIDWYADLGTSPASYEGGDCYESISLAAGDSYTMFCEYTYIASGENNMWAQVDTDDNVTESDESNNIMGPQAIFVDISEAPPAPLAKTGQAISYAPGDDGALQKGISWPNPRFMDNGDGTVTDYLTGLVWLKNADCGEEMNWEDALEFCNNLESGSCGLTDGSSAGDWRLPNLKELLSIIDYSQYLPALPSGHPFTNISDEHNSYYWSSTTPDDDPSVAWYVRLTYGYIWWDDKVSAVWKVWPVKGGN